MLLNSTCPFFHLVAKDLVVNHNLGNIYSLLLVPGEGQVAVLGRFQRPLQLDKLKTDRFNLLLYQLSLLDVLNNVLDFKGQNRNLVKLTQFVRDPTNKANYVESNCLPVWTRFMKAHLKNFWA